MSDRALSAVPNMDLQNENGHTLVEFRQADEQPGWLAELGPELDAEGLSRFNHLLGLAPSSAAAVAGNSKQLMTCTFEYTRLVQAKDGGGAIGAVYEEGTTKFGAQARFNEASDLKSLVTTGLILNVASQVLAQKHLADISERLQSIEQQVKSIHKFLEQSRLAKILTFQEHLQRIATLISKREHVLPDSLQLLAQNAQNVRAEVSHIRRDLDDAHCEIKNLDSSCLFGSNYVRETLRTKIDRVNHLQREYLLGMQCLLIANLILFIKHGGNTEFVLAGRTYMDELTNDRGLLSQWNATKQRVTLHLSKMKPVFEFAKSTQANSDLVEAKVVTVQKIVDQDVVQIRQLGQRLLEAQTPRVFLELKSGQAVRGHYLS